MARIKYDTGVTPLINEHYGYTFQPGRSGQVVMRSQPESRARYHRQFTRMQHLAQTHRAWAGLSAGEQTNWDNFAAALPQECKNPDSGNLSGYQNFLKRQYYEYLNEPLLAAVMSNPSLTEFFIDPCTFEIRNTAGELFIDYEFTNWLNDNVVSLYCSFPKSPGLLYQRTQPRYMGYITNYLPEYIKYGLLYNRWCATDARNIANTGWHVPTRTEYDSLMSYVGGTAIAGGKLKETGYVYWNSPNTGASNDYDFNLRGAGLRGDISGGFGDIKNSCSLWTSTNIFGDYYYLFLALNNSARWSRTYRPPNDGRSIRLIKDSTTLSNGQTGTYVDNIGQVYNTICINGIEHMSENLADTKFRNGDDITNISDAGSWVATTDPAWCYYNNDPSYSKTSPSLPLSLNITELYQYNFGIIPEVSKHLLFRAIPMSITNGQFFAQTKDNYEILA